VSSYRGLNPLIPGMEATTVGDLKSGYRDVKDGAKKVLRDADGKEDLGDKVGNLGDDIRRNVGNAGDDLDEAVDKNRQDEPRGV
jgi:hypothetical protein